MKASSNPPGTNSNRKALPTMSIDEDGTVVVNDFCIDKSANRRITILFREPTAKDRKDIRRIYSQNAADSDFDPDLQVLSFLCTRFGNDETFTTGELESDLIPLNHIRFLQNVVLPAIFPDLE